MLSDRILSTLKFFDLQDIPLTLFELGKFLLRDMEEIRKIINTEFEIIENPFNYLPLVSLGKILACLENELENQIEFKNGYYCLPGRSGIIDSRLNNYFYGFKREKRIKKYLVFLKFIPFVRGVAVLGSQGFGQQKPNSDIDLFIITDMEFLGLARTMVTAYFQILGLRRHGKKVANRFCLNHYLAGERLLPGDRNLYTAMEYLKLRPVVGSKSLAEFRKQNSWIGMFFPNCEEQAVSEEDSQSRLQKTLEKIFQNSFGKFLEEKIKIFQLNRIQKGEFIVADRLEMSFHPNNRKKQLFENFFEYKQ